MLNVGVKSTKNNHPSCQSLLGSSASMITEQIRMGTIVLELRARGLLANLVRTGNLPSILQQMALLTDPVHSMRQGQEVLTVVAGAMKMGMPILAAGAHLTGCHQQHRVEGDIKYVD